MFYCITFVRFRYKSVRFYYRRSSYFRTGQTCHNIFLVDIWAENEFNAAKIKYIIEAKATE